MGIPLGVVAVFRRGDKTQLTANFNLSEFECGCGKCPVTLVSPKHVERLQKLRDAIDAPISINSAYRCPSHNKAVGGEENSQHMLGLATDIKIIKDINLKTLAESIFDGIGIYDTFIHLDSRGYRARWDNRGKR